MCPDLVPAHLPIHGFDSRNTIRDLTACVDSPDLAQVSCMSRNALEYYQNSCAWFPQAISRIWQSSLITDPHLLGLQSVFAVKAIAMVSYVCVIYNWVTVNVLMERVDACARTLPQPSNNLQCLEKLYPSHMGASLQIHVCHCTFLESHNSPFDRNNNPITWWRIIKYLTLPWIWMGSGTLWETGREDPTVIVCVPEQFMKAVADASPANTFPAMTGWLAAAYLPALDVFWLNSGISLIRLHNALFKFTFIYLQFRSKAESLVDNLAEDGFQSWQRKWGVSHRLLHSCCSYCRV